MSKFDESGKKAAALREMLSPKSPYPAPFGREDQKMSKMEFNHQNMIEALEIMGDSNGTDVPAEFEMCPWDAEDQFLTNGAFEAAVSWQKKAEEYRLHWENACDVGRRLEVRLNQVLEEKRELEEDLKQAARSCPFERSAGLHGLDCSDLDRRMLECLSEIRTPALKAMKDIAFFPSLVKVAEAELVRRGEV